MKTKILIISDDYDFAPSKEERSKELREFLLSQNTHIDDYEVTIVNSIDDIDYDFRPNIVVIDRGMINDYYKFEKYLIKNFNKCKWFICSAIPPEHARREIPRDCMLSVIPFVGLELNKMIDKIYNELKEK